MMTIERPEATEYAPFYAGYVARVSEPDVIAALEAQPGELVALAARLPADRVDFRYAPDKWSVREIFSHLVDGDRVFGYRLFCVSRGDRAPLPGFDESDYVKAGRSTLDRLPALVREFAAVREANLIVARRLDAAAWARTGTANGTPISTRALAFIMAGHVRHHLAVLADRYGVA
jgi:DinB family protein